MDGEHRRDLGWWVAAVVVLLLWHPWSGDRPEPAPPVPVNFTNTRYTNPSDTGIGSTGPLYTPSQVGYENPAPGDDGTADCVPGQGPVYVGSSDPNGLDGDGDGIGCE